MPCAATAQSLRSSPSSSSSRSSSGSTASSGSSSSRSSSSQAASPWASEASPLAAPAGLSCLPRLSRSSSASTASTDGGAPDDGDFASDFSLSGVILGRGRVGTVLEGICKHSGKAYAIKRYRVPELSAQSRQQLALEVELHSLLQHPHIVGLEEAYEDAEAVHLVLEQLEGGDLSEGLLWGSRLDERAAAKIAAQLLSALAYLHDRRIVHRDLKPENVVYTDNQAAVKLIDFGLACRMEPQSPLLQVCGTLQYLAPEILSLKGYDEKCDIWSLGGFLYTMVTGKVLYRGQESDIVKKCRRGRVDYDASFEDLPEGLQEFIKTLLRREPSERPSAAQALEDPFLRQLAPEEVEEALARLRLDRASGQQVGAPRLRVHLKADERGARRSGLWRFLRTVLRGTR